MFFPQLKQSLDFTHAYSTCMIHSCDTAITDCITSKTETSSLTGDAHVNLGVTGSHFAPSKKPGRARSRLCQLSLRNRDSPSEAKA